MGSPSATPTASGAIDLTHPGAGAGEPTVTDLLEGFGPLLEAVAQRDHDSDEITADRIEAGQKFLEDFATACATEVRPAMEAVLERLRQFGGDGLVEERSGGEVRFPTRA